MSRLVMRALSFEIPTNKQKKIEMDDACKENKHDRFRDAPRPPFPSPVWPRQEAAGVQKPCAALLLKCTSDVHLDMCELQRFALCPSETPFCTPRLQPVVISVTVAFLRSLKQTVCPFTSDPPTPAGVFPSNISWPLQDIFPLLGSFYGKP